MKRVTQWLGVKRSASDASDVPSSDPKADSDERRKKKKTKKKSKADKKGTSSPGKSKTGNCLIQLHIISSPTLSWSWVRSISTNTGHRYNQGCVKGYDKHKPWYQRRSFHSTASKEKIVFWGYYADRPCATVSNVCHCQIVYICCEEKWCSGCAESQWFISNKLCCFSKLCHCFTIEWKVRQKLFSSHFWKDLWIVSSWRKSWRWGWTRIKFIGDDEGLCPHESVEEIRFGDPTFRSVLNSRKTVLQHLLFPIPQICTIGGIIISCDGIMVPRRVTMMVYPSNKQARRQRGGELAGPPPSRPCPPPKIWGLNTHVLASPIYWHVQPYPDANVNSQTLR